MEREKINFICRWLDPISKTPKECTEKLLEKNRSSKVLGYMTNIQKFILFQYSNNEKPKNKNNNFFPKFFLNYYY